MQRQARVGARAAALDAGRAATDRRPVPAPHPVAARRRRRRRPADRDAASERPARQHLHRVHLRQRVPPRPAPAAAGQADRRTTRTSTCRSSCAVPACRRTSRRRARRQRRPRADVRRPRRRARAVVRRRPLVRAVPHRPGGPPTGWRHAYLLEHWQETPGGPRRAGDLPLEPPDPDQAGPGRARPAGTGRPHLHTRAGSRSTTSPTSAASARRGWTYVEYETGERELYDLRADPRSCATSRPPPIRLCATGSTASCSRSRTAPAPGAGRGDARPRLGGGRQERSLSSARSSAASSAGSSRSISSRCRSSRCTASPSSSFRSPSASAPPTGPVGRSGTRRARRGPPRPPGRPGGSRRRS